MDNFSVLDTGGREVTVKGEKLKVSPLKVGQIPAFTRALRPCFAALAGFIASVPSGDVASGGGGSLEETALNIDIEKVAALVADHGDSLIEAAAVALRAKREAIEELELDEFIALVRAIVEVNVDFFGRAVAQSIGDRGSKAPGNGATLPSH